MSKTYVIPVTWQMFGTYYIQAESEKEAIKRALGPNEKLPEGFYVDDSMVVDGEIEVKE